MGAIRMVCSDGTTLFFDAQPDNDSPPAPQTATSSAGEQGTHMHRHRNCSNMLLAENRRLKNLTPMGLHNYEQSQCACLP